VGDCAVPGIAGEKIVEVEIDAPVGQAPGGVVWIFAHA